MVDKNVKVLIVSSAGGHLDEVLQLQEIRNKYEYLLVTEKLEATKALREKYKVKYIRPDVMGRGYKYIWNILVNFYLSFLILIK